MIVAPVTDAETETGQDGEGDVVPTVRGRGKPLENGERMAILQALLSHTENWKLEHGTVGLVSEQFKVSRLPVYKIWKRGKESVEEDGSGGAMVVLRRKKLQPTDCKHDYCAYRIYSDNSRDWG
jgi:hypothetical protein